MGNAFKLPQLHFNFHSQCCMKDDDKKPRKKKRVRCKTPPKPERHSSRAILQRKNKFRDPTVDE